MEEIWKDIDGTQGTYQISSHGRVKRKERVTYRPDNGKFRYTLPELLLNPTVGKIGYAYITIKVNGYSSKKTIHRLVGMSFIENPENKPCINHKNGIKTDNIVSNLEWCTVSENLIHSHRVLGRKMGWMKNKKGSLHPNSKAVKCITLGICFPSICETSEQIGIDKKRIAAVCNGKMKHVEGFVFKYM